jgi:myo-inositol-1(or 4)-monophosphatase
MSPTPRPSTELLDLAVTCTREGGAELRRWFGGQINPRLKESQSSVVTDADLASEKLILDRIRRQRPHDGIIAEESGYQPGASGLTWVVDPLDGTSNFAARLPWFGVMVAVLEGPETVAGAMYLPVEETLYAASQGSGATKNGQPCRVSAEPDLRQTLVTFGLDATDDEALMARQVEAMGTLVRASRNLRTTNSLVDFCATIDGRLGGSANLNTKVWDIAAIKLILREAGGRLTDLRGDEVVFTLEPAIVERSYAVVGAGPALLPQILKALSPLANYQHRNGG